MRRVIFAIFAIIAVAIMPLGARAAPSGLYGKSVTVTWSESRSQRDFGEPSFRPVSIPWTFIVYVSSEGRPFRRVTGSSVNGQMKGSREAVGAGGSAMNNGKGSVQFHGNSLVSNAAGEGFARRIQVNFDTGFSSCTAQVISAKQAGSRTVTVKSIATGGMVEIESVSAGAASCSIRDGNAFGN